ncbi:ABC-three component system protein [Neorhizobium alkalisoli]|uniref:ABC-three component system protein n=1 Tax=Neorhizobium alkalisoli TaxID=528178 RepID=UPI000CFA591F|nr:ABC-three component system protein [Neorhizobium alkalisoli]
MTVGLPFDDWLLVAGNPADSGLHFIGAFDRRITFYSQQVRALRLAHALSRPGKLKPNDNIAVVGAGAAGVTAALGLALLGNDVTLYDPAASILQLQSASPRLLHPHIYEWPGLGSLDDRAGLPVLDWSANHGGVVCTQLKADFDAAEARLQNLTFKPAHTLTSLDRAGARWRLGLTTNGAITHRQFDHVVLAIGFGDEISCGAAIPVHYWKQNSTGSAAAEPHSPATYIVSGNGDGGLTDLLNLLIQDFDHVGFTRRFLNYFSDDALRVTTEAACAGVAVGDDLETAFITHLLPLFGEWGVLDRLSQLLRSDRKVTINSFGPLFAAAKAAQLNQVMVFAVLEAAKQVDRPVQRSSGYVTDVVASAGGFQVSGLNVEGAPLTETLEHVILRHGPDRALRYSPAGAHFEAYRAHVTALLAARPDLNVPPVLDSETYDFFEAYRIEKLEDHASQQASQISVATARATLVMGIDPAAHVPVERGSRRLLDIADKCERLTGNIVLHLAVAPAKIAGSADIVRLARASGGRIVLVAGPDGVSDWQKLVPTIDGVPAAVSHYPALALDMTGLGEAIDACLLRLLDQRVRSALASCHCDTLGPLNGSIAGAVEPTWTAWHASLKADKALLSAFLRWLADVEQDERSPWNGDHASIPHLATALVMMLATHHGEPLEPAFADRGNLKFSHNAVALGSGCQMVGQQPIAIWDQPDQWGVDALILSGSSEVEVLDPPGRVLDGGKLAMGMAAARRVRPVVIRNDKQWRARLIGDLAVWRAAVEAEFAALRARQDKELEELSK